jgi:hypothetical protein
VRLKLVEPDPLVGATRARVVVAPIVDTIDASGLLAIVDRTGRVRQIPYSYSAELVDVDPPNRVREFDTVRVGSSVPRGVTIANRLQRSIRVESIYLGNGERGFRVSRVNPQTPLPFDIPVGGSIEIQLLAEPTGATGPTVDSLRVVFDCREETIVLVMDAVGTTAVREPAIGSRSVTIRPHPVSGITSIGFTLERPGDVTLAIVDAAGREVAQIERDDMPTGEQSIDWDASQLQAGTYFYRLGTSTFEASGSIVVVR